MECTTESTEGDIDCVILGPLLFLIYVNDLPAVTAHGQARQYADDTTISVVDSDKESLVAKLNSDMQNVQQWVQLNRLNLNVAKTQVMMLSRKHRRSELTDVCVKIGDVEAEVKSVVKCLGVLLDDELKWYQLCDETVKKCTKGLGLLSRLRNTLPFSLKKKVYNAVVLPHLDYCSTVWQECSNKLQTKIQRLQNYGARLLLNEPPRYSSSILRKRLGWLTLSERRKFKRLIVMRNCLEGRAPRELCRVLTVNSDIRGDNGVNTRGHDDIHLCQAKTEFGRSRFGFAGGKEWNLLPANLKRMRSSAGFNSMLKCYLNSTCLCV